MSDSPSICASLYVGDLNYKVTDEDLLKKFKEYGNVLSVRICRDSLTKMSLGYGYVNFEKRFEAKAAMANLNLSSFYGKPCRVMWYEKDPSKRNSVVGNIVIKNFDKSTSTRDISNAFSKFGKITSCKLKIDKSGLSKGCAFVNYSKQSDAERAIDAMNQREFRGNLITVEKFHKKGESRKDYLTNCYIDNCPPHFDDTLLRLVFEKYGVVKSARIMLNKDGSSKRFGFVDFSESQDAKKAVSELNEALIQNCRILVYQVSQKNENDNRNVRVNNLPASFGDEQLRSDFAKFGDLVSARVIKNVADVECPSYGLVSFQDEEDARDAVLEMDGTMVEGHTLSVSFNKLPEVTSSSCNVLPKIPTLVNPPIAPWNMMPINFPLVPFPNNLIRVPFQQMNLPPMMVPNQSMMSKQVIGEILYPLVSKYAGDRSNQVTHKLLDLDYNELTMLMSSNDVFRSRVLAIIDDIDRETDTANGNHRNITPPNQTGDDDNESEDDSDSDISSEDEESDRLKILLRNKLCTLLEKMDVSERDNVLGKFTKQGKAELCYMLENEDYLKVKVEAVKSELREGVSSRRDGGGKEKKTHVDSSSERIYAVASQYAGDLAARVTATILTQDSVSLNYLLNNKDALKSKVLEQVSILRGQGGATGEWPTWTTQYAAMIASLAATERRLGVQSRPMMMPPFMAPYHSGWGNVTSLAPVVPSPRTILSGDILANKQRLGEIIYPYAVKYAGDMAGKITGLLLMLEARELMPIFEKEEYVKNWIETACRNLTADPALPSGPR